MIFSLLLNMQSHPTWVRGLKHSVGACSGHSFGRTLRGCVDWNSKPLRISWFLACRTLRGCVDWNLSVLILYDCLMSHPTWVRGLKQRYISRLCKIISVAPYVGAWIETWQWIGKSIPGEVAPYVGAWIETSRWEKPLRYFAVAPYVGAWIETYYLRLTVMRLGSHPTWVRGLKHRWCCNFAACSRSHPTWVRGLKQGTGLLCTPHEVSHPTWVRGLKRKIFV